MPDRAHVRLAALGDGSHIVQTAAALIEPAREPKALPSIDIDIINGSLSYHDEVRRRKFEIEDFDLFLRSGERSGPVTLEGGLKFQGQPLTLHATATPSDGRSRPLGALASRHPLGCDAGQSRRRILLARQAAIYRIGDGRREIGRGAQPLDRRQSRDAGAL